ncbi:MAG TPA: 3-isopropylmalate dehydrogenase [Kofleriaceae bacterium]|nr:3-isopropylmalate dehydrogenase [Kofleriaceae bacterium]
MHARIALLAGDGIGPEVLDEARKVLDAIAERYQHEVSYTEHLIGGAAIDATGTALPEDTYQGCADADAVLLGAVGGPKWDDPKATVRPEQGLLAIRQRLGLWANLRPVAPYPCLHDRSPLRPEKLSGVDMLVIRELTGGLYFGKPKERTMGPDGLRAVDSMVYTEHEIRRVVELAFRVAASRRGKVTSIDKANVLETSRLWRQIAIEVAERHPSIRVEHILVDAAAMRLITHPSSFDVVVTENMFGDILTDEAAVLSASIGLLPSASIGDGKRGLYEPIHGSAPDIAGQAIANPVGTILSVAMMLRFSLGLEQEAQCIERAVEDALRDGARTRDVGGTLTTHGMGGAIRERLEDAAAGGSTSAMLSRAF